MIEHQEALKQIRRYAKPLEAEKVPLGDAFRCVLADNIVSPVDLPAFDNAAVDGYALGPAGPGETLAVQQEIQAGARQTEKLKRGTAARIFTGAPVPPGVWTVVMQEHTEGENGHVRLLKWPRAGDHIRRRGEDVRKGERLLRKGTVLEAQHLGLLAAAGFFKAPVICRPTVSVLATGSELVPPGAPLRPGQIYDANTTLLEALVTDTPAQAVTLPPAYDDPAVLESSIRKGLESDVLLVAGGVSVGKYDFVKGVLHAQGVREIFWKVNIKPGKPLYFGIRGRTLVFGLPGNPVSVFVTFQEYVRPALLGLQGKSPAAALRRVVLDRDYRNGPRRHFVRVAPAGRDRSRVRPLSGQGSHEIGSLAHAQAILEVPPSAQLRRGQEVLVKSISEAF